MTDLAGSIDALAQTLDQKHGNTLLLGTITDLSGLEERSLVEVELNTGSRVNAIAYTQADLQVGQDVVIGHIGFGDDTLYAIVSVNAPPADDQVETKPEIMLWKGPSFRPERIPLANGEFRVIPQTQQLALFAEDDFTHMSVDLRFSVAPNGGKLQYWLYGYDPSNYDFTAPPPWKIRIGSSYTSGDGKQLLTVFDLTSPGFEAEWIVEFENALFVLALERITATQTRASAAGRILTASIHFYSTIELAPLTLRGSGTMDLSARDHQIESAVVIQGAGEMSLRTWWMTVPNYLEVRGIVMGSV